MIRRFNAFSLVFRVGVEDNYFWFSVLTKSWRPLFRFGFGLAMMKLYLEINERKMVKI